MLARYICPQVVLQEGTPACQFGPELALLFSILHILIYNKVKIIRETYNKELFDSLEKVKIAKAIRDTGLEFNFGIRKKKKSSCITMTSTLIMDKFILNSPSHTLHL